MSRHQNSFAILAIFFLLVCSQKPDHGLKIFSQDFTAARLDASTGEVSCITPIIMPNVTEGCQWELPDGTRGQSSTVFYENQTFFFLARENCGNGEIGRTALLFTKGPFCSNYENIMYYSEELDAANDILAIPVGYFRDPYLDSEDYNMLWDHTCNVIVTTPNQDKSQFTVNQVSSYDGAQRFQPTISIQDGWRKVPGVGAVDFGNFQASWPPGKEWNCGNECIFYSIEEQIQDSISPRFLIGRSFRTGMIRFNISDSVQIQSLTYNPFSSYHAKINQFLGIGKCCQEEFCNKDCANFGENLVLISVLPDTENITILSDIGENDPQTIQIGVEFSAAPFSNDFVAYVFHGKTVYTYTLSVNNYVVESAAKSSASPPINDFNLVMWANPGY